MKPSCNSISFGPRHIVVELRQQFCLAAFWLVMALSCLGANYTNVGSADWSDGSNWTPSGGPPGAGDTATISSYAVTVSSSTVVDTLNLDGGSLNGSGPLTVSNVMNWTAGSLGGRLVIAPVATLNMTNRPGTVLSMGGGSVLENQGTVIWTGTNDLSGYSDVTFTNGLGAVWEVRNDQSFLYTGGSGNPHFDNAGTFLKTTGTGTTTFAGGTTFNNYNTVKVESGTLSVGGGGSSSGTFEVTAGSRLQWPGNYTLNSGTALNGDGVYTNSALLTVNSAVGVRNFDLTGTLNGSGPLTVSNVMNWTAGAMNGRTVIAHGATLNMTDRPGTVLSMGGGSVLENQGTVIWTGTNDLSGYSDVTITNGVGAVWEVRNDQSFLYTGGSWNPRFDNAGTFRKTTATGTTTFVGGIFFNNYGTVEVQSGTVSLDQLNNAASVTLDPGTVLRLTGGGSASGTFSVTNGSQLVWVNGSYNLNAGVRLDGSGIYTNSGTVNVNTGVTVLNLDNTGSINGSGPLTVSNVMNWTAGAMNGRTVIASGATLNMTNRPGALLSMGGGSVLENQGTVIWTGTNDLSGYSDVTWTNGAGALWEVRNDQSFVSSGGAGSPHFENAGTFRKTTATGTTTFATGIACNNYGTLDIESGIIAAKGGYTSTSNSTFNSGLGGTVAGTGFGQLQVSGTVTLNGSLSVDLTGGFVPTTNDMFTVLTAGTRSGTFSNFYYPSSVVDMIVSNTATSVIVVVTNIPVVVTLLDFGDAPDSYHTLSASGGAYHKIVDGVFLGATVDAETNGSPDALALGDGADEDGVSFGGPIGIGMPVPVTVVASTNGLLDAWVDFNRDRDFGDTSEEVFTNVMLSAGTNLLSIFVPDTAREGPTYARFRFSTAGGLSYDGVADDGEVEDYLIEITPCTCATNTPSAGMDPLLSSWFTNYGDQYALVVTNDTMTPTNMWDSMTSPVFADVQRIRYSDDYVYVTASGLASYLMGPWYLNRDHTNFFPNLPTNQNLTFRIPRVPQQAMVLSNTPLGAIGFYVNGTAIFNVEDGYSWVSADNTDEVMTVSLPWHRDAWFAEQDTFDPGNFHAEEDGQYHSHVNPAALRYQLGDNVGVRTNPVTGGIFYLEHTNGFHHSPIIGWAFDGYPVYGPYGYDNPQDTNSTIRRMVSGYALRDATDSGATNRSTLPSWAVFAQGRLSSTLDSADQGPITTNTPDRMPDLTYDLGRYIEDYDFLGDLPESETVGMSWDLDRHNGRCCKTPEFPNGTYAYFLTLDSNGVPAFPYILGPQYCGMVSGGTVTGVMEPTTSIFNDSRDWGDAPDSYRTVSASNGAFHRLAPGLAAGLRLGAVVSQESDGKPSVNADGDDLDGSADDEDGITFLTAFVPGRTAKVRVDVVDVVTGGSAYLSAWCDFNLNGDFADPGEQVLTNMSVATGTYDLSFPVPSGAIPGTTYARFRLSDRTGISYDGFGGLGEVEDYTLNLRCSPPRLNLPPKISVLTSNRNGTLVSFDVTATSACGSPPQVFCNPPSGSLFPIGTTTVSCTTTDSFGTVATASFPVDVQEIVANQSVNGLVLDWEIPNAVLEQADTPTGPWFTVPNAQSPLIVQPNDPSKFYRLRYTNGP